jgi:AcrR family transcriptional regulator
MEHEDLRVIKTVECIETAYLELLQQKDADKITVKELAAKARISKATFYLHYMDLQDLSDSLVKKHICSMISKMDFLPLFFSDPKLFSKKWSTAVHDDFPVFRAILHGRSETGFERIISETLKKALLDTDIIQNTQSNRMRLDFLIYGMLGFMPIYTNDPAVSKSERLKVQPQAENIFSEFCESTKYD